MHKTLLFSIAFFLLTLAATTAKADTVVLQGGVTLSSLFGNFNLAFSGRNSDGTTFSVDGSGSTIAGLSYPRPIDAAGGTLINLNASAFLIRADFNGTGVVRINGVPYSPHVVDFTISSAFVTVPFSTASALFLSAPCTVSGGIVGETFSPPITLSPPVGFSGNCGATLNLTRTGTDAQGFGRYTFRSLGYGFPNAPAPEPTPTPEPTTLVLLAAGTAGIVAKLKGKGLRG